MSDLFYDVVIIGGGPAGLACGQYSARGGRKTLILEEMACGGQTMIIDEIENYPGLDKIAGYEIAMKFESQAQNFGCNFMFDQAVSINKNSSNEPFFTIETASGKTLDCSAVVLATGCKHRELGVPGEKELRGHGVSYCATCDGPFFKGKKILVCGGGDSAVQEALYLTKLTDTVTVCHRRDRFRAQNAVVENLMATGKVSLKMSHNVLSINGQNGKVCSVTFMDNVNNKEYTEDFDAVFVFVGNIPQTSLAKDCILDENGFIATDGNMMTSIKGMYAAGDVRNTPFRQIVTAAADGAIAAHSACLYIDEIRGNIY